jgi:LuxR family maltose regulon positive regulatory protein
MMAQSDVLAIAKLVAPALSHQHVSRERLNRLFNREITTGSLLIAAPVGSGKTSLLAEWYHSLQASADGTTRTSWLSLRDDANDATTLWHYLTAALGRMFKGVDELRATDIMQAQSQKAIDLLINRLYEELDPSVHYVLFVDNAENITAIAEQLCESFIADLPDNIHLVMAGSHLPFRWMALGAASATTILNSEHLRFTFDEAVSLLERAGVKPADEDALFRLLEVTQGWALGLRAACDIASRGCLVVEDKATLNRRLSLHLNELFAIQVFNRLPGELEGFLFECAFLDRLHPSLCDHATNRNNSNRNLNFLLEHNIFISTTEDDPDWYSLHPLFHTWLIDQSLILHPDHIRELNYRASEWFERCRMPRHAARHVLIAGDHQLIEKLMASSSLRRSLVEEEFPLWILRFKVEDFGRSPLLSLLATWTYLINGRPDETLHWLSVFEETLQGVFDGSITYLEECELPVSALDLNAIRFSIECIRLKCASMTGRHSETISRVESFLAEHEQEMSAALQCVFVHSLAESYERIGRLDDAQDGYLQAEAIGALVGSKFYVYFNRYLYGILQFLRGRLSSVRHFCYQALRECPKDSSLYGGLYCLLSRCQLEMGHYEAAARSLRRATRRLSLTRNRDILMEFYVMQATLLAAMGLLDESYEQIVQTVLLAEENRVLRGVAYPIYIAQANIALQRHSLPDARVAEKKLIAQVQPEDLLSTLATRTISARISLACGHTAEAAQELSAIADCALEAQLFTLALEPMLYEASALACLGKQGKALKRFNEALLLGSANGFFNTFVIHYEAINPLLHEVLAVRKVQSSLRNFARRLQTAIESHSSTRRRSVLLQPGRTEELEMDLTQRECEVFRLLANGMTRAEITETLGISINTTKTHIANIFVKLGVNSRQQLLRLLS